MLVVGGCRGRVGAIDAGDDAPPIVDAGGPCDPAACADAGDAVDAGGIDDAGVADDAGTLVDAGDVDAGDVDAGDVDAGDADAGDVDAGIVDAGDVDAGDPCCDGGADAGAIVPRYVFFFVGDGMGAAHVQAARFFANADTAPLLFETFPHTGMQRTANASGTVTDSAAAGTALATGVRVANGVISLRTPGDGAALPTALELHALAGRRTGIVTTSTAATDATPAAFAAHAASRADDADIASDYLDDARPNVIMGGPSANLSAATCGAAGYAVATTTAQLAALDLGSLERVCGLFALAQPRLATRVQAAIEVLEQDDDGFFLLVEHEDTDEGAHVNDLARVVDAVLELEEAVAVALDWAAGRDDVLIVVTADHETGGLVVTDTTPTVGEVPARTWAGTGHTLADVPVHAIGAGAADVDGIYDNTALFDVIAPR